MTDIFIVLRFVRQADGLASIQVIGQMCLMAGHLGQGGIK